MSALRDRVILMGMYLLYRATNVENQKSYIGITSSKLSTRWRKHRHHALHTPKTMFHRAIAKHGEKSFVVEQIASSWSWEDLKELEKLVILQDGTFYKTGRGYNRTIGGDGGDTSSGIKRSASHIEAIKKAHTGKVVSTETRKLLSEANKRRVLSPEAVRAMFLGSQKAGRKKKGQKCPQLVAMNVARRGNFHHRPEIKEQIANTMRRVRAGRFWSTKTSSIPNIPSE